MTGHLLADQVDIGGGGWRFIDKRPSGHHHDPVGKTQQFIEVFAD